MNWMSGFAWGREPNRMRFRLALVAGLSGFAFEPAVAGAPIAEARAQAAVVDTMREMFAALTLDDEERLNRLILPGFYAFDGGHQMDGKGLYAYVKGRHASGTIYRWSVTDPKVHVSGGLATITYLNRGAISDASGSVPMVWLEAAILRLEKGRWRIEFIDSTRTPLQPGTETKTIHDTSPRSTYR